MSTLLRTRFALTAWFAGVFLLVAAAGFTQTAEIAPNDSVLDPVPLFDGTINLSLQSNNSFSVFRNEMDAAFSVDDTRFGETFSTLDSRYLFAGLANPGREDAVGTSGLIVGYFSPDGLRWSAVTALDFSNATDNLGRAFTQGQSTVPVIDGDETTIYAFVDEEETIRFYNVLAEDASVRAQFLTQLGEINTGLYLLLFADNSAYDPSDNFERETVFFYNTAGGGEEPDPSEDYTEEEIRRDFAGRARAVQLAVPVFLQTGELSHYARVGIEYIRANNSTIDFYDISATEDSSFTATLEDSERKDIETAYAVGLAYTLGMPGLVGGDDSRLNITTSLGAQWWGARVDESIFEQDVTFTAGDDPDEGAITQSETEERYASALGFSAGVLASHSLYMPIGESVMFGIEPTAGFGYTRTINAADRRFLKESVEKDYDADGELEETVTTEQERVGRPRYTADWDTMIGLPMALDIGSSRAPLGVVLGARPRLTHTWRRMQTTAPRFSSEEVVEDADGNEETTITEAVDPGRTFNVESLWTADVAHNIGFYFDITDEVRLDFALNGSNLLDFEDFTIQAIFALP